MFHDRHLTSQPPVAEVFAGALRPQIAWPHLNVEYACLPPFHGASLTRPNRLEVVFSNHPAVALEQGGKVYDVAVGPGSVYTVGAEPTTLLDVGSHSDTLEIYPDLALLAALADDANIANFELEPTLRGSRSLAFSSDPVILSLAHVLRQACLNRTTLADVEANEVAHLIAARVLRNQYGIQPRFGPTATLTDQRLRCLAEYIEAHLTETITLDALAGLVGISPFHFARVFKATTGLAPHQFVTARRFDLARRLLISTQATVQNIALSVGYENLSHFRRQFKSQFGVTPVELRKSVLL